MMGDVIGQAYELAVIGVTLIGLPLLGYIARSMQKVNTTLQRQNIALFGLKGDNGVVKGVRDLEDWRTEHELLHAAEQRE